VEVYSWKNGLITSEGVNEYRDDYYSDGYNQYGTKHRFSTHDWLAESALIILKIKSSSDPAAAAFINLLCSDTNPNRYKMYFLIGTEAPDANAEVFDRNNRFMDSGKPFGASDIYDVRGFFYTSAHVMYYNGLNCENDYCAQGAHRCWFLAKKALNEKRCKAAAFFLGAMTHYIADAGSFPHQVRGKRYELGTTDFPDVWEDTGTTFTLQAFQNFYHSVMLHFMYHVERERGSNRENDFFSIDQALNLYHPFVGESGWMAAYKVGLGVNDDRVYCWNQLTANRTSHLPGYVSMTSQQRQIFYSWNRETFNSLSANSAQFFSVLQEHINSIVLYCAQAINSAVADYQGCGGNGQSSNLPPLQPESLAQASIVTQTYFLIWGSFSITLAIFATLLATVESTLKEIVVPATIPS